MTTSKTAEEKAAEAAEKERLANLRTIATWKPGKGNDHLAREVTVKQAKDALEVELDGDLLWRKENNYRVDVSGVPEALLDSLKAETDAEGKKTFSFTEE